MYTPGATITDAKIYGVAPATTTDSLVFLNFPRLKWVLMGVPLEPQEADPLTVVGDDFDGQPANGINWEVARWDVTGGQYELYSNNPSGFPDFSPGLGFWVVQDVVNTANIDVVGTPRPAGQEDTVAIAPPPNPGAQGKNMVANPFIRALDWSTTKVYDGTTTKSITDAALSGWISAYATTWNYATEQYEIVAPNESSPGDTLRPWEGFWVTQLDHTRNLKLVFPYPSTPRLSPPWVFSDYDGHPLSGRRHSALPEIAAWALDVWLVDESGSVLDTRNRFGVSSRATGGRDGLDAAYLEPPVPVAGTMYFLPSGKGEVIRLDYDFRDPESARSGWDFEVRHGPEPIGLKWPNITSLPGTVHLSLLQGDSVLVADLHRQPVWHLDSRRGTPHRLRLKITPVTDETPPRVGMRLEQSPGSKTALHLFPSEPLREITVEFAGQPMSLLPNLYNYNSYLLSLEFPDEGHYPLFLRMVDESGLVSEDTVSLQIYRSPVGGVIATTDGVVAVDGFQSGDGAGRDRVVIVTGLERSLYPVPAEFVSDIYAVFAWPTDTSRHLNLQFDLAVLGLNPSHYPTISLFREGGDGWQPVSAVYDSERGVLTAPFTTNGTYALLRSTDYSQPAHLIPSRTALLPSYPNPFNAVTVIPYNLASEGRVKITVFDLRGREILVVKNEFQPAGQYQVRWHGVDRFGAPVASGIYFIQLETADHRQYRKITLLK
jgi:hypothetical protein